jgi:hypothetical protein
MMPDGQSNGLPQAKVLDQVFQGLIQSLQNLNQKVK